MKRPPPSNDRLYAAVNQVGNYTMAIGIIDEAIKSGYAQKLINAARALAEWRRKAGDYPIIDSPYHGRP